MMQPTQNRVVAGSKILALGVLLAALIAACLLAAAMPLAKPSLAETTFTVDRNDDPDPATANACTEAANDCSLRGAIVAANAATGADAITLPAGTYTLTRAGASEDFASTGDLDITDPDGLTITGAGARATIVAGGAAPFDDRIFENRPDAKATITGLTITGGKVGNADVGGGVYNQGGLTLERVAVKDNTASGDGGGIKSNGALNITDSTVSGNNSEKDVGGIYHAAGGTANITNSTISGNKATRFGGGIIAVGARINVRNSTIAFNKGGGLGGNIMAAISGTVITKNTIVAGNPVENCNTAQFDGVIFSQGNNISSDDSCPFTEPTDKQNTNPLLGPLQDNGGPTDTQALLAGSPAIDAANNASCPDRDQRGVARKDGDKNGTVVCDIGSFERNDLSPPKVNITSPADGKTGVKRNTDLSANFSERMDRATLNKATFKLFKVNRDGSTTQITAVSVSSSTDGLEATLNPDSTLQANTTYKAVVTTGARDVAGNRLDQDRRRPNNQPMEWFFTTGSS